MKSDISKYFKDDVQNFIPDIKLFVDAYKVPSRMMHLHQMSIRFRDKTPTKNEILEIFSKEFGVAILNGAKGTAEIRKKGSRYEICSW